MPEELPSIFLPEQAAEPVGAVVAQHCGDVLVAPGHGGVGPAHEFHDGTFWHTEKQQHGGGGVARVV
jgi:hypothetical protein